MKPEEQLKKGLDELGITVNEEVIEAFVTYISELKKWNRIHNLTALKSDEDIVIKHFLDSLLYLNAVPDGPLRMADIGSGAGFPGLPIKIVRPEIELTLVESSAKKTAFLRHIIRQLKISRVSVIGKRVEELLKEQESLYDIIVSRATYSISEFLKIICPLIRTDGSIILSKGPKLLEELKELENTQFKDSVRSIQGFNLPFSMEKRNLVTLDCHIDNK